MNKDDESHKRLKEAIEMIYEWDSMNSKNYNAERDEYFALLLERAKKVIEE